MQGVTPSAGRTLNKRKSISTQGQNLPHQRKETVLLEMPNAFKAATDKHKPGTASIAEPSRSPRKGRLGKYFSPRFLNFELKCGDRSPHRHAVLNL